MDHSRARRKLSTMSSMAEVDPQLPVGEGEDPLLRKSEAGEAGAASGTGAPLAVSLMAFAAGAVYYNQRKQQGLTGLEVAAEDSVWSRGEPVLAVAGFLFVCAMCIGQLPNWMFQTPHPLIDNWVGVMAASVDVSG